ncbi:MAG: META domain-containing protein [Saprospiraceae bacterium]|nr:META domain-containing protein [Saprospiraceae bacterium]
MSNNNDKGNITGENNTITNKTKLLETPWHITNFTFEGKSYELNSYYLFNIEENSIGLSLDVNNCGFSCSISNNFINIKEAPMCTEKCCDSNEALLLTKLLQQGKLNYRIDNKKLMISNSLGSIDLKAYNKTIIGTEWIANSYTYLKGNKEIKFEKEYILIFENERIRLKLDVNNCHNSYTIDENKFIIELPSSNMGCTRKCCDSKEGELLMLNLQGRISYKIVAEKLVLQTNNKKIVFSKLEDYNNNE